jgi:hypothetical protein
MLFWGALYEDSAKIYFGVYIVFAFNLPVFAVFPVYFIIIAQEFFRRRRDKKRGL